jgi:hypothetical protein
MVVFDHLKLARRNLTELARYRRFVLGCARGEVTEFAVEHEHDGRCCRVEPWPTTNAFIVGAILPQGQKALIVL